MNKTRISLLALSLLLVCSPANSVSEYEQWKQQQQQSFQQYKDERDREFTAFLKEHWREVELLKGVVRDEKPKPVVMPVAKPQPLKIPPQAVPGVEPQEEPVEEKPVESVIPEPTVVQPIVTPPAPSKPVPVPPSEQSGIRTRVDYFGKEITFYYDPAFKRSLPYRLNEKALSNFWSELSKTDYEPLLEQLNRQAKALQLNDWGYAVLTNKLAEKIYPTSTNKRALFNWFVLTKAGFSSRVAYNERNVYLLVPSEQRLYEVTYFTFDNERYYAINFDGSNSRPGNVYTYDGHYPGADKKIDMSIRYRAAKGSAVEKRNLSFEYGGQSYDMEADYEQARVDFLNTYPQLDLEVYFAAEVGVTAESPLLLQLAKELEGMTEQEGLNFLLRFVQTSFKYSTDEKQFGKENYLFPEETIFYPYSDCEDRSVLFAWLVRRLLGLEVVGLNYPGHVATAVQLKHAAEGDYVTYDGKRYAVADPTYINATVGMTMPEYKNDRPDIILIK
jgi:hypothetical protein